jgi:Flp pilus assembly pilin Flp
MLHIARRFAFDQDGAVTVDWVVLTAAVVGLAVGAILTIQNATTSLGGDVSTAVSNVTVGTGN